MEKISMIFGHVNGEKMLHAHKKDLCELYKQSRKSAKLGTHLFLVDLHDGILSTHDTILVTWHYNLILVEDWGRNVYFGTCLFSQFVDQGVVWSTDEWVVDVGNLQSLKGKFGL